MSDLASLFLCPACKGRLAGAGARLRCAACARDVPTPGGVLDLVHTERQGEERQHYDRVYQNRPAPPRKRQLPSLAPEWSHRGWPERQRLLDLLGDLRGKRVLLLGTGDSHRELMLLLRQPELLVYSDLSPHGLAQVRDRFDLSGHADRVVFAAMDAMDLPIADGTFDIVYGYAFVHHLPELDAFFSGVARVLKPGGRAMFMDDGYAPLWFWSKRALFPSAVAYAHRKEGISPEDYRHQLTGGFREAELGEQIRRAGGEPWFERMRSLHYAYMRTAGALFPGPLADMARSNAAAGFVWNLDRMASWLPGVKRNRVRLIWGFDKP